MTTDKKIPIFVFVFACGILFGVLLAGLFAQPPAHPVKQSIYTGKAPQPIGPYSQAVRSGNLLFLSGQIGLDPATGNLTGNGAKEQARQAMENQKAVLAQAGLGFDHVVQTRIYLTDLSDWNAVNEAYAAYFNDTYPARAAIQTAGLPKGAKVEIEMVAQAP